jgi:hypothetical protein
MEGEQNRTRSAGTYEPSGSARTGRDPFDASSNGGDPLEDVPPQEALKSAGRYLGELKAYAGNYLAAKLDGMKLSVKRLVIFAGLGVVGLIIAGGLLVTAAVLLLNGLANLLATVFSPPKPWFGQLIVGFVVIAGALAGTWLLLRRITNASKQATIQKYQAMHDQQRREYGHDVSERSRQTTRSS